jgi:hypothetical protein
MFGTNKLCMKGIYLPTFQRSIILRLKEGYKKFSLTTFAGKNLFHFLCFYIYIIFLCLLNALVHRAHPFSSPKNLGEIIVPIYRTREIQ